MATTAAAAVISLLESLGVRRAYGLTGGPIAPFCDLLGRSRIESLHCRHESGAAFAALEDSLASGAPTAVFVTTGPGVTNALTGMCAARWEGGRVLLISASTSPREVGRRAFQETSEATLPSEGLFRAGAIFDDAWRIADPRELPAVARALAQGLRRPQGWVGHLSLPIVVQTAPCERLEAKLCEPLETPLDRAAETCAELLRGRDFAIWAGFGARAAAGEIVALAERTGAAVMCSPRGKGIFPEDHPQFVGVTGFGSHSGVKEYVSSAHPERILVLGSRLGEFTSFWDPDLVPRGGFVHVDLDPNVPDAAFPGSTALAVRAEIGAFLRALLGRLDTRAVPRPLRSAEPPKLAARADGPVRPVALLDAIQRCIVERTDAIVFTEAGNAFAWGSHGLRFRRPRYRTSTGWGSMGHATCGVIGAAKGRSGPAVALVGDGAMLMQTEVSTAVQYGIPAAWIVMNDAQYGMIEQGMRALRLQPLETSLPETDFAAWARSLGADGVRVLREAELDAALAPIASLRRPLVVDVRIDAAEPAPFLRRIESLLSQAVQPAQEVES
ncbi:MAG TPA: thiamine pyrophosphate-binding protein [Myxococcota bacterium]|nr:thiamine pyrophosphate-binding protein [Myxococcota bacterium]